MCGMQFRVAACDESIPYPFCIAVHVVQSSAMLLQVFSDERLSPGPISNACLLHSEGE